MVTGCLSITHVMKYASAAIADILTVTRFMTLAAAQEKEKSFGMMTVFRYSTDKNIADSCRRTAVGFFILRLRILRDFLVCLCHSL